MEFRLVYQGALPAAGSGGSRLKEKHAIRKALHPQLRELWHWHPALEGTRKNAHFMKSRLTAEYERFGCRFLPLVCEAFHLICSLEILFLRREAPGAAVHGGDLDNRLKVILDGLRVPAADELAGEDLSTAEDPFYCLLGDDRLVTEFTVTTDRLLAPLIEGVGENDVHLVIKVGTKSLRPGEVGIVP